MYNKSLHRYTFFTAICTGILIFIGGLVTSTGSGLSVPDWPTTFGENMFTYPIQKWVGGVQYEHGHRLFASFIGFLIVSLVIFMKKKEERKWVRILSYYALFAVILQGIFGGLTVLLKLPPAVSIIHGMLAQSFFCLVASLALFTSQWWIEKSNVLTESKNSILFKLSIAAATVVFVQLFFGALLRHTYSGLAIPDFPLSYGQIIPSLSPESLSLYNQKLFELGIKHSADRPVMAYQIIIHLIHRTWAYIAVLFLLFTCYRISKSELWSETKITISFIISLIMFQFTLGFLTVLMRKPVIITTLHVFVGALILMLLILLTLQIGKIIFKNSDIND